METKLTARQVCILVPNAYPAHLEGLQEMSGSLLMEEFGTREPDEIWEKASFTVTEDGELHMHQSNDVTMVWNHNEESWDDLAG